MVAKNFHTKGTFTNDVSTLGGRGCQKSPKIADKRGEGVKNLQKYADVICESPLSETAET